MIDQSTEVEGETEDEAMVAFDACAVLVRCFPQSGPWNKHNYQLFRWDSSAVGSLGKQGLTLSSDGQDPFVVNDDELPKVFWVGLDFGSMPSPLEVFAHARLAIGQRQLFHDAPPGRSLLGRL